jgi:hypothetical protein
VPLSDDQKAMLRLLAQREEGYDDMAALMGISVEEVRERVKEALVEVDEEDATARPEPPSPPVPPEPMRPTGPPHTPPPPAPPAAPGSVPPSRGGLSTTRLPKDRGALIGLGLGALAVLGMAIALIVSGSGSGSGSSTEGNATSPVAENENLTEAALSPVNGGEASGRALFGRYKKSVLLQVEAEGLAPPPTGEAYTVWLYRSPKLALQVGAVPEKEGKIAAQLQIPTQLLAYVASGAFNQVDVALTSTAAYKAALTKAKAERKLPPHLGESILRGEITGPAIRKQ